MPFKTFETREAVPEAARESALELKDGKWAVEEAPDPALGAAGQKALDDERTARKAAETAKKLAEKERDELKRTADAKEKGISEEQLVKIRADEAAARAPIEQERDRLIAENRKLKLTDRVKALALKHGVMTDRVEDAMLILDRRTDLTDADGIAVKDKDGKLTSTTIEDFLSKEFKAERPWLYSGTGASGSGTLGSDGNGAAAGAYDAVKAGKDAAAAQKLTRDQNKDAFR